MSHQTGLDGVIAARTVLSEVDGARGRLLVRGEPIERAATRRVSANAAGRKRFRLGIPRRSGHRRHGHEARMSVDRQVEFEEIQQPELWKDVRNDLAV